MKVSLRWLSDYIELPTTDPDELAHALDMLGHGVENVEVLAAGWTDVVVGRVAAVEAHPDADQVRITRVDLGTGDLHQIICGAWNFDEGAIVPVAVPGAVLPGGLEIGTRKIRGVVSHGMICSERELGLGDVHEGIMVLDDDAPLGLPFESILELPDVVFDLDITNNRPDVMGMVGVARELAAWFDVAYTWPDLTLPTRQGDTDIDVTVSATDGCNRFVAREVRDVTMGPSPLWMRERLRRAGVRSISNVVDVTNYVMFELGHPLHAFDADTIVGNVLDVRWAQAGERLVTLDGADRTLVAEDLVIADGAGPTSLAAVMGGARSEVRETTSRILMEAANWNPPTVMYTSRRLDLRSEASARFERGVDPNLAPAANDRACKLLAEIGGGAVLGGGIDVVANVREPVSVNLPISEVRRLLGDRFEVDDVTAKLRRLDLSIDVDGDLMRATVPTFRPDLTRPADLIEEVARLADYDTFDETLPTGPAGGLTPEQHGLRRLHDLMRGLGLHQAVNLPFVSPDELDIFLPHEAHAIVSVRNPLRDDQGKLRQRLLPGLMRNLRDNVNRGSRSAALFETGRVFLGRPWSDDERVPEQPMRLGIGITGPFGPPRIGTKPHRADARTALAVVAAIAEAMGCSIERRGTSVPGLHPTRAADLLLDGVVIGVAGELHPDVAAMYDLPDRVAAVEVDLAPIVAARWAAQIEPPSTYPHVDFDLSFDVSPDLRAADLVAATAGVSAMVESAEVFDEYRPEDTDGRSIAVQYRLRAPDRTLASEEIAATRDQMITTAAELGASLRGAAAKEDG